jgi:hypothetical protein
MPSASEELRRLREALSGLVADDVPELLAEARTEARARVRAVLTEAMADAMLEQVRRTGAPAREPEPRLPAAPEPPLVPDRAPPAATPTPDSALGYYVYGVMDGDRSSLPALTGVDADHTVTVVADGELAALVSRIPLAEWGEERLREHLADMGWVETVARRHEEVLEAVAASRTLIPMRLCTIYRDQEAVRGMMRRETAAMRDALRMLAGRAEWAVKVFSAGVPEPAGADVDGAVDDASSGAAYLQQRQRAHRSRARADERQTEACEAIHARLGSLAVRALLIPSQRPEVSGHSGEMLFNGVYLLDEGAVSPLLDTIEALQSEFEPVGLELVATGPWPAYNFVPDAIGATP